MRRLQAFFAAFLLCLTLTLPTLAVSTEQANASAQLLYNLGLFRGTGTNPDGSPDFSLTRAPTRAESVTMLVRLLGGEQEALSKGYKAPFTDVPEWAKHYVGYAYQKGYTKGMSATEFGSARATTTAQYLTFLLRALGYKDGTDFKWDTPWTLTDSVGITNGSYGKETKFLRADAAYLSEMALYTTQKGTDTTILVHLTASGALKDSSVVIWDYDAVAFEGDFASFLFYPIKGSPATFTSFKLNKVTVNGLPCKTLQVTTPKEVTAYLASIGYNAGGFGYVELTYSEKDAIKAATEDFQDKDGNHYPILKFSFSYTATQVDGTKVSGSFTASYYVDKDGE